MVERCIRAVRGVGTGLSLLQACLALPPCALAGGVVGGGMASDCTEAALDAVLAGGGAVTFNCGSSAVVITLTNPKVITKSMRLDGGGLITLSGGGTTQLFIINHGGVTLTLANVTVSNGTVNGGQGGAIYNKGKLIVTNSIFSNNTAPSSNDGGAQGGAIFNKGTLSVTNSIFATNSAGDGGAIYSAGTLSVIGSSFSDNLASTSIGFGGNGGAILSGATLSVTTSSFSDNRSDGYGGGAIWNFHKASVADSTFANNTATFFGGAILNVFKLTVARSTFSSNSAFGGGAIESFDQSKVTITASTFVDNNASAGGAIDNEGTLTATNSTFADNSADSNGGGAISNVAGTLKVTNCTFVNNDTASGIAGTINNVAGDTATLRNTVVAGTSVQNCLGDIADKGHNLDSGGSCGFRSSAGSLPNTDAHLDPAGLADNGGPTQTVAVEAGSPLIGAGNRAACKSLKNLDQRGYARPGTGSTSCTIGAYEFNSPGPRAR